MTDKVEKQAPPDTVGLEKTDDGQLVFSPDGAVLASYIDDDRHVVIIRGPIGCLSGDTEFLTRGGWKRMDAYVEGDEVAEWARETGAIEFLRPQAYVDEPCAEMWSFRNCNTLSMMLSDEHRVPHFTKDGAFRVARADYLARSPGRNEIPVTFTPPPDTRLPLTDDEIRLAVAINADGHFCKHGSQIVICVRKERKKTRLRELFLACGVEWQEQMHGQRETELKFVFQRDGRWKKEFGPEWWAADRAQLAVILDECLFWDGLHDHAEHRYYTTKKGDADFIQYAAHACGRRASIGRHVNEQEGWRDSLTVHMTLPGSRKGGVWLRGDNTEIERVPAPGGRKYCFTTSTGFFVARHDGRIFVTGNSGTSSASCMKIYRQAIGQRVSGLTGKRRSKWAVIRNTYPELLNTTIKTWLDWFPEHLYGKFSWERPPMHPVRIGDVELDVIFLALDEADDIKKLRSLELTGAWFNELEYANKAIFDETESRTGRFPSMKEGGSNWDGVIADMNAPNEDHWLPVLTGEVAPPEDMPESERELLGLPSNWGYHIQPAALDEVRDGRGVVVGYKMNPRAENQRWLKPGYYEEKARGKTKAWIDSRLRNVITMVVDGEPVWPSFSLDTHVAPAPLQPVKGHDVVIGMDFGRRPCAVFAQEINNRLYVQRELRAFGASSVTFAPIFKRYLERHYPGFRYRIFGDPKGQDRGQADDRTSYDIFKANGIIVTPAPVKNNHLPTRLSAVDSLLNSMHHGQPRFQLSPADCPTLKAGMAGRYHVRKNALGDPEPVKDKFSDVADCLQYIAVGMGEGRAMTGQAAAMSTGPVGVWKGRRSLRRVGE